MDLEFFQDNIYHMVPFANLPPIFAQNSLLSKQNLDQLDISFTSIANEEVQQLRSRIFVLDKEKQTYQPLHSYVPFYFADHTPMLYVQYTHDLQSNIIIFEISRAILNIQGALFTNGNASTQQLSKFGSEKVGIIPATSQNPICNRTYKPQNTPLGTNSNRSDFYSDIKLLDQLDWSVINDRDFQGDEKKRIKHAEVLIPEQVPLDQIKQISVATLPMVERVNMLIKNYGLEGHIPLARWKPELFF